MKTIANCSDVGSLTTFGSSDPTSLAAFAGKPFFVNQTTGATWVQTGGNYYKATIDETAPPVTPPVDPPNPTGVGAMYPSPSGTNVLTPTQAMPVVQYLFANFVRWYPGGSSTSAAMNQWAAHASETFFNGSTTYANEYEALKTTLIADARSYDSTIPAGGWPPTIAPPADTTVPKDPDPPIVVPPNAVGVTAVEITSGLARPWAVAQLPNGKFLVTERAAGTIKLVDGANKTDLTGVPATFLGTGDQHGGMMDLILDSGFATNRVLYFTHVQGTQAANAMRVMKATLSVGDSGLQNVQALLTVTPSVGGTSQYGGRLAEGLDGTLFVAAGDRDGPHSPTGCETAQMRTAQDWTSQNGKILRINKDGSIPADNPFASNPVVAQRAVYAKGFRNMLGAAVAPDGRLWINENGPQGGDEINRILPGLNYGWPNQSYGTHYGGCDIPDTASGVEPPAWYSSQAIAPSGMLFIKGTTYGAAWQGDLVFGSLADYSGSGGRRVNRLKLNAAGTAISGGQTAARTTLWGGGTTGPRCRDVRQGADGKIYVLVDDGRLMRLDPTY